MKKTILFITLIFANLFLIPSLGLAQRDFLFERIVVFGASISARYGSYKEGVLSILFGKLGSQDSPADWLAKNFSTRGEVYLNFARANSSGRIQIEGLLANPSLEFQRASLLISVDGLMKDAQDGKCEEVVDFVHQLTKYSQDRNLPLVLGNLPSINSDTVDPLLRYVGWKPVASSCRDQINKSLRMQCLPERGCFILDLDQLYRDLENDTVFYQGQKLKLSDLSFDGLHLTPLGAQFLGESIYSLFRN